MRMLRKVVVVMVALYAGLLAGLLVVMQQPTAFGQAMKRFPEPLFAVVPFKRLWFIARAGRLAVGDPAPDFALPADDRKSEVRLAAFHGQKPVVLIFGSYT